MAQYGHKKDPDGFCIAPDYSCVVTWEVEEKLIFVWDYNREETLMCVLRSPIIPLCVALSADGKLLAVRDEERLVIYQTTGEQKADLSLVGLVPKKADYCDNRPIRSPYLSVPIVHQLSFWSFPQGPPPDEFTIF